MKRNKHYRKLKELLDTSKVYTLKETLSNIKKVSEKIKYKFDESLDISINLNLKTKYNVRDVITLPHLISNKERKILVFAKGEKLNEAEKYGATYFGGQELIDRIKNNWFDFDVAISTPDMMKNIGKLGSILGKKGLMPNVKTGTVTFDIKGSIDEFKKGKLEFKSDKMGIIHFKIGKCSMELNQLFENAKALYNKVLKCKPSDLKGEYIKSIFLSSTMGLGLKINCHSF